MSDTKPAPSTGTDPENPAVPEAPAHAMDVDTEAVIDELDVDPEVPSHHVSGEEEDVLSEEEQREADEI